jgi:hypothetical protein
MTTIINAAELIDALGSVDEQREMFLLKFHDVERVGCTQLADDFMRFDIEKKGELTEHQALLLLEDRHLTKTATELRELLRDMRKSKSKNISFVEFACSFFNKNFDELNNFADEESKTRAKQVAKEQEEKLKQVMEETKRKKDEDEAKIAAKAAQLEYESTLVGHINYMHLYIDTLSVIFCLGF